MGLHAKTRIWGLVAIFTISKQTDDEKKSLLKTSNVIDFYLQLSTLMGPPIVPPLGTNEWVTDTLYMSRRLLACEPTLRACVTSHHAHLLLVGPDACAKK